MAAQAPAEAGASISVIIPALNEELWIGSAIQQFDGTPVREVIVVDGGSSDATVRLASELGARVVRERANRGCQMNAGARESSGNILLFVHADTALPHGFPEQVRETLSDPGVAAGAFRFATDEGGWRMRLVARMVSIRCKLFAMPYGDQALFLTRETFQRAGGFSELRVMEDFDLVRRLKRLGRVELASGTAVTSARSWRKEGTWRLTWAHQMCILGYYLGIPTDRLERLSQVGLRFGRQPTRR